MFLIILVGNDKNNFVGDEDSVYRSTQGRKHNTYDHSRF